MPDEGVVGSAVVSAETERPAADAGPLDRRADDEFFGFEPAEGPGALRFVVQPHLTRHDGRLFGGTAAAAVLSAIERATGRRALWATTQFVGIVDQGAVLDCVAEVLAEGRRTSQARVTATCDGEVIFVGLGASGVPKADADIVGTPEQMPVVGPPSQGRPAFEGMLASVSPGWHERTELLVAPVEQHPVPDALCLWGRSSDGGPWTPARLAFFADAVPVSVARACGRAGGGTSLDNSLRVAEPASSEWALLDFRPHHASGGYGYGTVHLWAQDGTLMATGSQSASMITLPPEAVGGMFRLDR